MGDSVQTLRTVKSTKSGSINLEAGDNIQFAVSSRQGRRQSHEDAYVIEAELRPFDDGTGDLSPELPRTLPNHALFAVFDGHGTDFASTYTARNFVPTFSKQLSFLEYSRKFVKGMEQQSNRTRKKKGKPNSNDNADSNDDNDGEMKFLLSDAIKSTMIELDANMLLEMNVRHKNICEEKKGTFTSGDPTELYFDIFDSGTTAIIVVLTPQYVVCANLGDSRAILQRSSDGSTSVISLSKDHKPNNVDEVLRIRNAGGEVIRGLIEGRLAVSRGLGDFSFKHTPSVLCALDSTVHCSSMDDYVLPENQMVTPVPEIMFYNRAATSDKFITIASDGIWDVLSNDKCAEIISKIFDEGEQRTALVCEEVLDQCYAKGSLDNMTLVLIKFPAQNIGIGGGVLKRRKQRLRNW